MQSVALITGGSKGIGLGIAKAFAKRGYALILVARNESDLRDVALALAAQYAVPVTHVAADLSQPQAYNALYEHVADTYGKLDVLVNNAGDFKMLPAQGEHGLRTKPHELASDVAALFAINAVPPSALAHALHEMQLHAAHPKQLDILSSAALEIFPGNNPYGVTKAAHERLSLSVVAETRGRIKTYRVYPSNTDTRIVAGFQVPKLTPDFVGEQAVAMLHNDTATDLYLKMTAGGLLEASGALDYGLFKSDDGTYDGLALVRAHRELLAQHILPTAHDKTA
jgi:NAD(P)-dependent dehydrogenase (short-subunit alcohol dehydrogenase family)